GARLRGPAGGGLGTRSFVVPEEDDEPHSTRFSARNATIASAASAAEPSATRRLSPRAGGGASARTTVRDSPAPPTSSAPSFSCGFAFPPMIPFSAGYPAPSIASQPPTTP